jgi:tight adherence protein B
MNGLAIAVAALSMAAAVFFGMNASIGVLGRRRLSTEARLGQIAGAETDGAQRAATGASPWRRPTGFDRRISGLPLVPALKRDLRRAGLSWQIKDYVGIIVVAAAIGAGIGWLIAPIIIAPLLTGLVGATIPVLLVKRTAAKRASTLNGQIVDLIEVLASSLRSGFGFVQSMELAARQQADPLGAELRVTLRELALGVSTDDAMERLGARVADEDLDIVITAVLIQRRVGGNLAEVLDNISHVIRDRVRVRGEVKTLTSQARFSAWIVGLLPVGLSVVISIMQPHYMDPLFLDPGGRVMLLGAITLQVVGFLAVRRIAAIEY